MTVSSRVVAYPQPQHEISDLAPLRAVPLDVDRRKEPEPAQQVEPVGTTRRRAAPTGQQITQELRHRLDRRPRAVQDRPRQHRIAGRYHPPDTCHDELRHIPPAHRRVLVHHISAPGRSTPRTHPHSPSTRTAARRAGSAVNMSRCHLRRRHLPSPDRHRTPRHGNATERINQPAPSSRRHQHRSRVALQRRQKPTHPQAAGTLTSINAS